MSVRRNWSGLVVACGLLLWGESAKAAIAYEAAASGTAAAATSVSYSVTCSGANRLLLVSGATDDAAENASTGATHNSVGMTLKRSYPFGSFYVLDLYYLVAPDTGSQTVTVTWPDAQGQVTSGAVCLSGVHQSTPLDSEAVNNANSGGPMTVDVSSATDDLVVDAGYVAGQVGAPTVGGGQTSRYSVATPDDGYGVGSTEAGAASVTMSWTLANSNGWGIIGVSVNPAAAAGGTPGAQLLLGVGR
jgi:hypothetical protein